MSSRKCKYDADAFCFICGQFIKVRDVKYELKTSHVLCEAYEAYFDCPVRNQDKPWAPHVACSYCKRCLEGWYRGEKRSMKFAIPRIWREPKDHITDCYFCMVNPSKRRRVTPNICLIGAWTIFSGLLASGCLFRINYVHHRTVSCKKLLGRENLRPAAGFEPGISARESFIYFFVNVHCQYLINRVTKTK
ncbi:uncharacterized protein [Rhodnius prolixus]|uniref:uncharacterized protein n=1 Tax=Rhodnius prolixus TaxID=13249 RepID=UPI003D18E665